MNFAEAFPELANPATANRNIRSAEAARRDRAIKDAYRRIQRQGWEVATVVNLHSFQLDHNMGALGHLTIPAKKAGEMYALKVLDIPRMGTKDLGEGNIEAIPVFPKEMAEDLTHYYRETGGVFFYTGVGPVPGELLEAAVEAQLKWYWNLYNEGRANWGQYPKNTKHISDRMRDAAKELARLKLIDQAPEWVVVTRAESPDFPCDTCGQIIPKIAKFCTHCETIYDVPFIQARRPDIWLRQNPVSSINPALAQGAGGGSGFAPDLSELISQESKEKAKK